MSFDDQYFKSYNYANRTFGKYSMYWWSNRFTAALARRYGRKGTLLIDIGSGMGDLVASLEADFATVAFDVNRSALIDSRMVATRSHHVEGSATVLPFANNTFGVVICKHVLEHLLNEQNGMTEIARVLEPNGIAIIATPNLRSPGRRLKGERWHGYRDPTHIALREPDEWISYARNAGLQPICVFSDGMWDAPYLPYIPTPLQKALFGVPGGAQAVATRPFLPLWAGESVYLVARRASP